MARGKLIERDASANILESARMYPVVTLCGPRQSGKTTLARHLFPDYDYVSLEDPDERLAFETFIRLLASRVGQIVNYSSLAGDVGVSATTIKEWVSMLEASYIVFTLRPYYKNYGKRLTKSPKIYFTETGLVTSLLGIKTEEQVGRDPLIWWIKGCAF